MVSFSCFYTVNTAAAQPCAHCNRSKTDAFFSFPFLPVLLFFPSPLPSLPELHPKPVLRLSTASKSAISQTSASTVPPAILRRIWLGPVCDVLTSPDLFPSRVCAAVRTALQVVIVVVVAAAVASTSVPSRASSAAKKVTLRISTFFVQVRRAPGSHTGL